MSGMVLTPASPTPEKSVERQSATSESERPAERFDAVSAREQARLERKEARQDRADQKAADNRAASRQSEQDRLEESRSKSSEPTDKAEGKDTAQADKPASEETSGAAAPREKAPAQTAVADGEREGAIGDEVLPMLFTVPVQSESGAQAAKGLALAGTGMVTGAGAGAAGTAGAVMDKLMMQPLQPLQQGSSGNAGNGESMLTMKGEQLNLLAGKAVQSGDGKALDFSAQLARFQGGSDATSLQNNANSLQRGAEGRESLAALKSYSTSVDLPVQHAQWGEKVAGKLAWLTAQRMQAAEIHVTPPDLGPLEVRVQVQQDQAHVTVHATHSAVRDQLELNSHRLRDMLQENGLSLDKFEVSAESSDQGDQQQLAEEGGSGAGHQGRGVESELEVMDDTLSSGSLDLSWRGEVDLYA